MQKPGTPSSMPSKTHIFNWIKQIVPEASSKMKVEDLGDGVIYCKIINHYFPGSININRLNLNPKNQYDFTLNLKMFQNALTVHKINLSIDVGKISKQKFLQNWGLINSLYRQLSPTHDDSILGDDSKSVSYAGSKFTPKRSFETAFPNEQTHKLAENHGFIKPVYNHSNHPTVHYQSNQLYPTPQHSQPAPSILPPNVSISQPSINHLGNQQNLALNGGSSIYHAGINQTAFGSFGFGINNLNSMNFNPNQNSTFNKPQHVINRETINPQINKISSFDQPTINKCWSVGKIPTKQTLGFFGPSSQQNSGKFSVNSHIFQNNYNAVIDRVKQILLKNSHDIEKIRQIKILLNIPINDDVVKIQEDENVMVNCTNINKNVQENQTNQKQTKIGETKIVTVQMQIATKQKIQGSKENIELPDASLVTSAADISEKANKSSKSLSNSVSSMENQMKQQKVTFFSKMPQGSAKKIKNNFPGEGVIFRK